MAPWVSLLVMLLMYTTVLGNEGTEFVLGFLQIEKDSGEAKTIYLTPTTQSGATVQVVSPAYPDLLNETVQIAPGKYYEMSINAVLSMESGTYVDQKGIYITSSGNITVMAVNRHNVHGHTSNYASFLAKPSSELGLDYYGLSSEVKDKTAASILAVVATDDGTNVSVTLTSVAGVKVTYSGGTYRSKDTIIFHLNKFDLLQIQAMSDLSGSHVVSTKPIAVYSGTNRTRIYKGPCLSTLMDQLPRVDVWGKNFVTVPFPNRKTGDVYRILSKWSNTGVFIHGQEPFILGASGDWHEVYLNNSTYIETNKPVEVVQIAVSGKGDPDEGDPALVVLSPQEASISKYTFTTTQIATFSIYVVAVVADEAVTGLILDQNPVNMGTVTVLKVDGASFSVVVMKISPSSSSHMLYHADGRVFLAYVYAAESCVAMAHSLGGSVGTFYKACTPSLGFAGDGVDNDCDGKIDEETCCKQAMKDDDLDLVVDEDCGVPKGTRRPEYVICCDGNNSMYYCLESVKHFEFVHETGVKHLSANMSHIHVPTKLSCFKACTSDLDCWGVNYNRDSSTGPNCQILRGLATVTSDMDIGAHYTLNRTLVLEYSQVGV